MQKTTKKCFILRRYYIKATGTICADIRNERDAEYCTCLCKDGRSSCSCRAGERGQKCYHVKHLRESEDARKIEQRAQEIQRKRAQEVVPIAADSLDYRQGRPVFAKQEAKKEEAQTRNVETSAIDPQRKMENAALNGNRAFSLMR